MTETSEIQAAAAGPATRPLVRVVVINFDGGDVTLRCLDALLASDYPTDRLQIVLIDNASVDGLNWTIRDRYPQVVLIESDVNEGFARGCNLALGDLDTVDFVALINNDAIVDPGWLNPLLAGFTHDRVGAVCPKLLLNVWAHTVLLDTERLDVLPDGRRVGVRVDGVTINGRDQTETVRFDERFWPPADEPGARPSRWTKGPASIWWNVPSDAPPDDVEATLSCVGGQVVRAGDPSGIQDVEVGTEAVGFHTNATTAVRIVNSAGGALYTGWFGGDRGFLEPDLGQYDHPAEVFAWCGGAVVLRAAYLREVGVFDPQFFLYYEDFDLSWRGRAAGWSYRYEPSAVVFHEHAYSSKAGSAFFSFWVDRNRRLTLVKNAPARVAIRAVVGSGWQLVRDLLRHTLAQARRRRPPSPRLVRRRLADFWSFLAALPSAYSARRATARTRVVTHAEIGAWMVRK